MANANPNFNENNTAEEEDIEAMRMCFLRHFNFFRKLYKKAKKADSTVCPELNRVNNNLPRELMNLLLDTAPEKRGKKRNQSEMETQTCNVQETNAETSSGVGSATNNKGKGRGGRANRSRGAKRRVVRNQRAQSSQEGCQNNPPASSSGH